MHFLRRFLTSPLVVSWANSLLGLFGFLILTPVAATHLSRGQFTAWLFANSVIGVGIIFETAVSVVYTRILTARLESESLSSVRVKSDPSAEVSEFMSSTLLLYIVLSIFAAISAYCIGRSSIEGLMAIGLTKFEGLRIFLSISAVASSSVLLAYTRSVLIADQNMRAQRFAMLCTNVLKLIVTGVIFVSMAQVDTAMNSTAIINTFEGLLILYLTRRLHFAALKKRPRLRSVKDIFAPFSQTFLIRVGNYVTLYSASIIVVRYLPNDADSFLLSFRLAQAASSVSMIPVSISLPALTRMRARIAEGVENIDALKSAACGVITLGMVCMALMFSSFVLLGNDVIRIFAPGKFLLPQTLLAYMCCIFFLEGHANAHAMVFETQNRIPYLRISLISGVAVLALTRLFVPWFGALGGLLALNLVQMSANNWVPVRLNLRQWSMTPVEYFVRCKRLCFKPSHMLVIDPDH